VGDCRQTDDKCGALPADIVVAENLAAVLLDDAITDAEAKPRALSHLFGGKERIENLVGMRNPVAVIGKRDLNCVSGLGGHDFNASGTADFMHGVIGVVENVEEHLLQLMGIADNVGESFVEMLDDIHAVTIEVIRT
jgi:hypothetical protein